MQDFVNGDTFHPYSEEPARLEIRRYRPRKFFISCVPQSPLKICHAAAVRKTTTRRLIGGIILASVINASSLRRRGLVPRITNQQNFGKTAARSWRRSDEINKGEYHSWAGGSSSHYWSHLKILKIYLLDLQICGIICYLNVNYMIKEVNYMITAVHCFLLAML